MSQPALCRSCGLSPVRLSPDSKVASVILYRLGTAIVTDITLPFMEFATATHYQLGANATPFSVLVRPTLPVLQPPYI